MNKRRNLIVASMLFVLCLVSSSESNSILARRGRDMGGLYTDDVARHIGDILTINISEESKVDTKVKRNLEKSTDRSVSFNGALGIVTPNYNVLPRMPGIGMESESSNKLDGKSNYKDERSFVDRITVVVEDIMPNGNLVIVGIRNRNIVNDKQIIEVSGIVRPSDIAFDNTVSSAQVADFRLVIKNVGVSKQYNEQGWLGKLFDFLWPL